MAKCSFGIERQKKDFIRLGVLGAWDAPYQTMALRTEADIVRSLGRILEQGYLFKGLKPVNWCIDCRSALAEAEVEYEDKRSLGLDVAFPVVDLARLGAAFGLSKAPLGDAALVIWTTTPWTLPANQAVCVHPDFVYQLIDTKRGLLVLVRELAEQCLHRYGLTAQTVLGECTGRALEHLALEHPFYARQVPVIVGTHVTLEAGTGLVHTAPAHGADDFVIVRRE